LQDPHFGLGASARPRCLPLLFAALTGRSGHGLARPLSESPFELRASARPL